MKYGLAPLKAETQSSSVRGAEAQERGRGKTRSSESSRWSSSFAALAAGQRLACGCLLHCQCMCLASRLEGPTRLSVYVKALSLYWVSHLDSVFMFSADLMTAFRPVFLSWGISLDPLQREAAEEDGRSQSLFVSLASFSALCWVGSYTRSMWLHVSHLVFHQQFIQGLHSFP